MFGEDKMAALFGQTLWRELRSTSDRVEALLLFPAVCRIIRTRLGSDHTHARGSCDPRRDGYGVAGNDDRVAQ
jgi:hypothetical protein